MSDQLKLWTFMLSPFAGKVRAAFDEKGVDVELAEIHIGDRPARLRELNPFNRVPVLEVGSTAIRESSLICEWLEETHPEPALWPADANARGYARSWARYIDDTVVADFFGAVRRRAFGVKRGEPEDIVAQMMARLTRYWPTLERVLTVHDGPWVMGEQFTYADLSGMATAVRMPQWAAHLLPDEASAPSVLAWFEALRGRSSAAAIDRAGTEVLRGEPQPSV